MTTPPVSKPNTPQPPSLTAQFHKSRIIRYLVWAFALAYGMQVGIWLLQKAGVPLGQFLLAVMMFIPLVSVLLSGEKLSSIGWKLHLKKNVGLLLIAWFTPAILTLLGAALYFLVFPSHFDITGAVLKDAVGAGVLEQLKAQGITYPTYILISLVGCLTYAPLLNGVLALGEEVGWRGFLYPQLKVHYGRRKGLILGGIIWGAWHWPIIWLIGYNYGSSYLGFPILGMLLFCLFTIAAGTLCDWLYDRSGSILLPAIFHGAINAVATIPVAVCLVTSGSTRLLGPAPVGLLAGIPLFIAALLLFMRTTTQTSTPTDTTTQK